MNDTRILAIDDEPVILQSIAKLCSAEGWRVDACSSAEAALKKLDATAYTLVISDIMMPRVDGFQLLDTLRSREITIPVIMTTGFATVENAVKSLAKGAIDFLPKPFTYDELVSAVSRGLVYGRILTAAALHVADSDDRHAELHCVPCPPKYRRLGYASWCWLESDGSARIGVTDLFLRTIETINAVDLCHEEDEIVQGNSCVQVTTEDQLIHNLLAPLSGYVVKRNERVLTEPTLVEKDPFFRGWLYQIVPKNLDFESKYLVTCGNDRL